MYKKSFFIFLIYIIHTFNCDLTDKEVKDYIIANCIKIPKYYPPAYVNIKKQAVHQEFGKFKIWKVPSTELGQISLFHKMITKQGDKETYRSFFNIISSLKEKNDIDHYFPVLNECYYHIETIFGIDKDISKLYFLVTATENNSTQNFNLSAKRLSFFKFEAKFKIFRKIVQFFSVFRNKGYIGLALSLKDFQLLNEKDILQLKIHVTKIPQFSKIDPKEKNLELHIPYKLNDLEDYKIKYIHPLLKEKSKKDAEIQQIETSDLYNLGILFMEIFGLKIEYFFKNYEEIKMIEEIFYSGIRRIASKELTEKNEEHSPFEETFLRKFFDYYIELFFSPPQIPYTNSLIKTDPVIIFIDKLERECHCQFNKQKKIYQTFNKNILSFKQNIEMFDIFSEDSDETTNKYHFLKKSYYGYDLMKIKSNVTYLSDLYKLYTEFKKEFQSATNFQKTHPQLVEKFRTGYFEYMGSSFCLVDKNFFFLPVNHIEGVLSLNDISSTSTSELKIEAKFGLILALAKTYKLFETSNLKQINLQDNEVLYSFIEDKNGNENHMMTKYSIVFTNKKIMDIIKLNYSSEDLYSGYCENHKKEVFSFSRILKSNPDVVNFCITKNQKAFHKNTEVYNFGRFFLNLFSNNNYSVSYQEIEENLAEELKKSFFDDSKKGSKIYTQKNYIKLNALIMKSISLNPSKRPSMDDIIKFLSLFSSES